MRSVRKFLAGGLNASIVALWPKRNSLHTTAVRLEFEERVTDKYFMSRMSPMSGAISYKSKARIAKKGPYAVLVEEGNEYFWCSCGNSQEQPFCDALHQEFNGKNCTSFEPKKFVADETKRVFLCGCKQSKKAPFCDGSHSNL